MGRESGVDLSLVGEPVELWLAVLAVPCVAVLGWAGTVELPPVAAVGEPVLLPEVLDLLSPVVLDAEVDCFSAVLLLASAGVLAAEVLLLATALDEAELPVGLLVGLLVVVVVVKGTKDPTYGTEG